MAEEETFKVTDRRGRPKDEAEPAQGPAAAKARPAGTPPGAAAGPSRIHQPGVPPAGPPEADLSGLLVMLASSAVMNLGEAADPVTGQRHVDLEQAREAVDLLVVLRTKTEGNRTAEESRLLDDILYDLQMRFVRMASPGGAEGGRRPTASG